ncbi:MAG: hypothetical protein J3K34DRAFT_398969 [Monoraphidium minutum]|nr:MAG: hypothetical protein J3K34DRAFT_398969 [Monoraphidium minutum]
MARSAARARSTLCIRILQYATLVICTRTKSTPPPHATTSATRPCRQPRCSPSTSLWSQASPVRGSTAYALPHAAQMQQAQASRCVRGSPGAAAGRWLTCCMRQLMMSLRGRRRLRTGSTHAQHTHRRCS